MLNKWLSEVSSWDLCDHLCNNLVRHLKIVDDLILTWTRDSRLYFRRAGFASIACVVGHRLELPDEDQERYVGLIREGASDQRHHVRTAVSWALRELGKIGFATHDLAMNVASDLIENGSKAEQWVGRDAMRELRTLLSVPERRRLLTSKSKMGRKAVALARRRDSMTASHKKRVAR